MKQTNRRFLLLILISWFAYLISYLGRNDYGSCLLEIVQTTGISRASAGMVSSAFALCNAIGQLVSTVIINKVSPTKLIAVELFSVSCINFLFPVSNQIYVMMILWAINGAMQATLLCGITRIFAQNLKEPWLSRGAVSLNTIGAVGGMVNYLLSPLLIRFFHWQTVFFTIATMLLLFGIAWCIVIPRITESYRSERAGTVEPKAQPDKTQSLSLCRMIGSGGVTCAVLAVFVIGSLRESVSMWIPSYLNEGFALSVTLSTAVTAVVPMLQISGALLAGRIGCRTKNLFQPALITFLISSACFLLIPMVAKAGVAVTVVLFVVNAISMTAALTFLLSLYPIRCVNRASIAKLVGLLNFFVHLGDFFASTGFGWLSTVGGWGLAFSVMAGLALVAVMIALIGMKLEKRRKIADVED